ncbi:hypothetical protein Tco_0070762 [Tanacetum coccineum]
MRTSKTYQQSLADAGSETRPLMLERGSYIPWVILKLQTAEDLQGDVLLHYDAEMELMNLILLSIPNDIYNSVNACTSAKDIWKRVEHLMRGTIQNKVDRETRFTNEFDQFVAEPGESLVSVYNRFAQLMNDLERNDMHFPIVTINIKFLNSLQLELLKYVTQVSRVGVKTTKLYYLLVHKGGKATGRAWVSVENLIGRLLAETFRATVSKKLSALEEDMIHKKMGEEQRRRPDDQSFLLKAWIDSFLCLMSKGYKGDGRHVATIGLLIKLLSHHHGSFVERGYRVRLRKKGDERMIENHMILWLIAEESRKVKQRCVEKWMKALEDKGLRISRDKTEYLRCDFGRYDVVHQEVEIRIGDRILQPKESFRYLGSVIHRSGRVDDDVAHRIRARWVKWRAASGVLCDKRIPLKLKGKFYRVAIRPTMIYGLECWPITKAQANRVEVVELRMLRWTCGKSMVDMIPNGVFKAELDVDSIIDKMREKWLRWFGHLKRTPQTAPVRRVEAMVVDDSRRRGRPKLRWEDRLKQDLKELRLSEDMTSDRNA